MTFELTGRAILPRPLIGSLLGIGGGIILGTVVTPPVWAMPGGSQPISQAAPRRGQGYQPPPDTPPIQGDNTGGGIRIRIARPDAAVPGPRVPGPTGDL